MPTWWTRVRNAVTLQHVPMTHQVAHRFGTPKPIDQLFAELRGMSGNPRVSRDEALSVPAVMRGRNLICSIATLPLVQLGPNRGYVRNPLLEQLDVDCANVVTLAQLVEDLLFESIGWLQVTARDFADFPLRVRHRDVSTVSLVPPNTGASPAPLPSGEDPRGAVVWVDGKSVPARDMIRFDSPNPALLKVGGRAIKRALLLDRAARMYADDPRPLDYFTPADGADPVGDDEVQTILAEWQAERKKRGTAYIPASLKYNSVDSPSPAELQLVELQKQASLDLANALGVDPEDLGISTTSRTYFNAQDRKQSRINDVLSPFMRAVTDRLSMGDVTRRGHRVTFDLRDYMKADPATRVAYYQGMQALGAIGEEEIREMEDLPPMGTVSAMPDTDAVDASRPPSMTFDRPGLTFVDVSTEEFSVNRESRRIEGLIVPYGRTAMKGGIKYRFRQGSLQWSDPSRIKLLRDHDPTQPLGKALSLTATNRGVKAVFAVARGIAGDEAISLAEDGVLDGFSVGVDFDAATDLADSNADVVDVARADLRETSLTAMPTFDDARVSKVAASRTEGNAVSDTATEPATAPADPAPQPVPVQTFTADQVQAMLAAVRQPAAQPEPERPEVVNPTGRPAAVTATADPPSYRFDRRGVLNPAAHDFGIDIVKATKSGNPEAPEYRRVMEFIRAQFNVISTDINELTPTLNLPRYIDQRDFQYPIWSAVNMGAPPNGIQPFQWPAFSSASGLVANHTEGTEPTSGTYVTTSQSVTPAPVSGKVKISREVWDMGGTPGLSNLLWTKMLRDWNEALEARIVATLDAATPTSLGTFTIGGGTNGQTLVKEMTSALASLQFVRGGFRFDTTFSQIDLYKALAGAVDTTGRPIFPAIGPTNADGTVDNRFQSVNIAGVPFLPAWALAATGTVAASSYLIDRTAVDGWATAPQRLDITQTEVANVYIGVWGYAASAINDINGVREVIYDPV
jgi:HK97 family phage prohead protease